MISSVSWPAKFPIRRHSLNAFVLAIGEGQLGWEQSESSVYEVGYGEVQCFEAQALKRQRQSDGAHVESVLESNAGS
jgi:hypothetical protein